MTAATLLASPKTRSRHESSTAGALVFHTQLGWIAVVVRGDRLTRLTFGHEAPAAALAALGDTSAEVLTAPPAGRAKRWVTQLRQFASGRAVDFSDVEIAWPELTEFQRRVYQRCRQIAYGETLSYAELAAAVGSPNAARAIGNCMAHNPVPLVVPCHRVLASGGRLGGYSAAGGLSTKARLLAMEQAGRRRPR